MTLFSTPHDNRHFKLVDEPAGEGVQLKMTAYSHPPLIFCVPKSHINCQIPPNVGGKAIVIYKISSV